MSIIVLDTETTGNEPPEVIELAYGWLDVLQLELHHPHVERFCPSKPLAFGALATHHILSEELIGQPPSSTCKLPAVDYIVGHNCDYDWKALASPPVKRICTLAIARALYPECDSHSLGAMLYRLHPSPREARELLKGAHSALTDVSLCAYILCEMANQHSLAWVEPESIWEFSEKCRIPKVISFGKHKGTPVKDLPRDYKQWLLRQPDMDPYLIKAIKA